MVMKCPTCETNTELKVCPNCDTILVGDDQGKERSEVEAKKAKK